MLIPTVCQACGFPIGDVSELYEVMREKLVEGKLRERKLEPTQATFDVNLEIETGEILDALGVPNICCRIALTTTIKLQDYY